MSSILASAGRPGDCLTATLHHVALGSPDPERLAEFYSRALGYRVLKQSGVVRGVADKRELLFLNGRRNTLMGAGFAVLDEGELARLRCRIAAASWPFNDGPTELFSDAISLRDPDGTPLSFGLPRKECTELWPEQLRSARIQHVVVASQDPSRLVTFFTNILGFTVSDNVTDDDGGLRTSFLRCSHEHHSLAVFKAAENRLDHCCYETVDWNGIRDWCDHLSAEYIPLQWGPGRHGPGNNLFVFFHDPDGNWVELSAELEIVAHDRPVGSWSHEERTLNSWGKGYLRS